MMILFALDRRRVEVVEQSELFFAQPITTTDPASGLTPAISGSYRLRHTFDLQRSDDRWIIVAANPHLGFGPPPPTQVDKPVIRLRDRFLPDDVTAGLSTAPPAGTSEKTTMVDFSPRASAVAGFNWQAVIDWAYTYVFDYSPSFREYPNDCTNFLIVTAAAIFVAAAVLVLADGGDPTRRPMRAGAAGGATPEETAHRYVAALNERDEVALLSLSVVDSPPVRRSIAERVVRDGGRGLRVDDVAVHPGVAGYHARVDIVGGAYRDTLELNERDENWLIVYTHEP